MIKQTFCRFAFDHIPGEVCAHCKLTVDAYGNTEQDFTNCSFPDCGCDGARLCMAGSASPDALRCNVEGMYRRTDPMAVRAKLGTVGLSLNHDKKETK